MLCEQYLTHKRVNKRFLVVIFMCVTTLYMFYTLILCNQDKLRYIVKNEEYTYTSIDPFEYVELNDCIVKDEKLCVTGNDPYIVYKLTPTWVWDVYVNMLKDYEGTYKVYYAFRGGFSENNIGTYYKTNSKPEMRIGQYIDFIRIDFNDVTMNDTYSIVEKKPTIEVNRNERIKFWIHNTIEMFLLTFCQVFLCGKVSYDVLMRVNYIRRAVFLIVYNILTIKVWVDIVSMNPELYIRSMFLGAMVCTFLWFGNMVLEKE